MLYFKLEYYLIFIMKCLTKPRLKNNLSKTLKTKQVKTKL